MIPSNLDNLINKSVSCIISRLNYSLKGQVQNIDREKIVLSFDGFVKIYPMSIVNAIILDNQFVYINSSFINSFYSEEKDDITIDEKKLLDIFFQIVENYPVTYGFKNNNLCLKKINQIWYVFDVVDSNIININAYEDLINVIMSLFCNLTDNYDYRRVWLKEFNRLVKKEYKTGNEDNFLKRIRDVY